MRRNKKSKKLECVKYMPPLRHSIPGQPFDIRRSEAVAWLIDNPDVLNYLWDHVHQSGYVQYDIKTETWRGTQWKGGQT